MTTTAPSTDVAVVDPTLSDAERYAFAAFLARYRSRAVVLGARLFRPRTDWSPSSAVVNAARRVGA